MTKETRDYVSHPVCCAPRGLSYRATSHEGDRITEGAAPCESHPLKPDAGSGCCQLGASDGNQHAGQGKLSQKG